MKRERCREFVEGFIFAVHECYDEKDAVERLVQEYDTKLKTENLITNANDATIWIHHLVSYCFPSMLFRIHDYRVVQMVINTLVGWLKYAVEEHHGDYFSEAKIIANFPPMTPLKACVKYPKPAMFKYLVSQGAYDQDAFDEIIKNINLQEKKYYYSEMFKYIPSQPDFKRACIDPNVDNDDDNDDDDDDDENEGCG